MVEILNMLMLLFWVLGLLFIASSLVVIVVNSDLVDIVIWALVVILALYISFYVALFALMSLGILAF